MHSLSVCKELWLHWWGENWPFCGDLVLTTEGRREHHTEEGRTDRCVQRRFDQHRGEERSPHRRLENWHLCSDLVFTKERRKITTLRSQTGSYVVTLSSIQRWGNITILRMGKLAVVWWPCVHQIRCLQQKGGGESPNWRGEMGQQAKSGRTYIHIVTLCSPKNGGKITI